MTLQYENDMILFLIHLKKKLFKGQGGAMEMPQHGNASKGGGLKFWKCTGDYHFISMGLYACN